MKRKQHYSDEYLARVAILRRTNQQIKEATLYGDQYQADVLTAKFQRLQRRMRNRR